MRVGPSGRAALHLLACCPRIPTDVVANLLRMRHTRSAAQLLQRLRAAGLVRFQSSRLGPVAGSPMVRLWTLTPAGRAFLDKQGLAPLEDHACLLPYGEPAGWPDTARQRDTPMLVATYRLLAQVACSRDRPVRLVAWEHPWIRSLTKTETGRLRRVRLPAAAVLMPDNLDGEQPYTLLLLPDLGALPVASYRTALRRLIELRQVTDIEQAADPLLVVGVAIPTDGQTARRAAWRSLFEQVARQAGERPLHVRVVASADDRACARNRQRLLGDHADQVLGLAARHPLLEVRQLAALLDTSTVRAGQLVRRLTDAGWIRVVRTANLPPDTLWPHSKGPRELSLIELTSSGRREAAGRLGLPTSVAARHHGLLGNDTSSRQFSRHLAHTLGANGVFAAFASAARRMAERGGDEALEEWRSAAACARGRFRPDGYGCYRRGAWRFGFFLEYDRGTEKPREYAAKLATYYRYHNSGVFKRDYRTFPTVLVVTTSQAAEAHFAHQAYLAQNQHGDGLLQMFLTSTSRIEACADGPLGPIWRAPSAAWAVEKSHRLCWLPRLFR